MLWHLLYCTETSKLIRLSLVLHNISLLNKKKEREHTSSHEFEIIKTIGFKPARDIEFEIIFNELQLKSARI